MNQIESDFHDQDPRDGLIIDLIQMVGVGIVVSLVQDGFDP